MLAKRDKPPETNLGKMIQNNYRPEGRKISKHFTEVGLQQQNHGHKSSRVCQKHFIKPSTQLQKNHNMLQQK